MKALLATTEALALQRSVILNAVKHLAKSLTKSLREIAFGPLRAANTFLPSFGRQNDKKISENEITNLNKVLRVPDSPLLGRGRGEALIYHENRLERNLKNRDCRAYGYSKHLRCDVVCRIRAMSSERCLAIAIRDGNR